MASFDELSAMSISELKKMCEKDGLNVISPVDKQDFVDALLHKQPTVTTKTTENVPEASKIYKQDFVDAENVPEASKIDKPTSFEWKKAKQVGGDGYTYEMTVQSVFGKDQLDMKIKTLQSDAATDGVIRRLLTTYGIMEGTDDVLENPRLIRLHKIYKLSQEEAKGYRGEQTSALNILMTELKKIGWTEKEFMMTVPGDAQKTPNQEARISVEYSFEPQKYWWIETAARITANQSGVRLLHGPNKLLVFFGPLYGAMTAGIKLTMVISSMYAEKARLADATRGGFVAKRQFGEGFVDGVFGKDAVLSTKSKALDMGGNFDDVNVQKAIESNLETYQIEVTSNTKMNLYMINGIANNAIKSFQTKIGKKVSSASRSNRDGKT